MGGIISSIISPGAERKKKEKRAAQAATAERQKREKATAASAAAASAERAGRLAKQRKEEGLVAQAKGRRRVKAAGKRRRVFTSPLGLSEKGTDTLA